MRKQKTSTTSGKGVYGHLGIDSQGKSTKKKKVLTRKELRKQERDTKKSSKQTKVLKISTAQSEPLSSKKDAPITKTDGPIMSIFKKRKLAEAETPNQQVGKKSRLESASSDNDKVLKLTGPDPYIDAENKEIARLEKLMGIKGGKSSSKQKAAAKLNKEYELFEGIGSNFGDFLMDLDDLTDMIEGKGGKERVFAGDDVDESDGESPDEIHAVSHLIDDDEQEQSDLDDEVDDNSEVDDSGDDSESDIEDDGGLEDGEELKTDDSDFERDDSEDDDDDEERREGWGDKEDANLQNDDETEENSDGDNSNDNSNDNDNDNDDAECADSDEEEEANLQREKAKETLSHAYQPTKGEDIYGRLIAASENENAPRSKYVPPGKRAQLLTTIDESSEKVKMIRRQMNGLMNRLSDATKDSVVRSIKTIFDANSLTVANTVLKDCVMAACSNTSQLMTSLIPIYASMIAALHVAVGADVGAFIIETLAISLHSAIEKERTNIEINSSNSNKSKENNYENHKYITSKLANNSLLLLVYLYNLRVLHHTLIVDIMTLLAGSFQNMPSSTSTSTSTSSSVALQLNPTSISTSLSTSMNNSKNDDEKNVLNSIPKLIAIGELEVELLVCLVDHCGAQLRSDDPLGLKTAITTLNKRAALQSAIDDSSSSSDSKSSSSNGKSSSSSKSSGNNVDVTMKGRDSRPGPGSGSESSLKAGVGLKLVSDSSDGGTDLGKGIGTGTGMGPGSTRLRFMLEALTDLRNNKSRRIQSANADIVKDLRRWLGLIKNSLGGGRAGADLCLRVSLNDLLDAEKAGRWWKAGASWAGKKGENGIVTRNNENIDDDNENEENRKLKILKSEKGNPEEEKLLLLAQKMRFNTATRRNIFVVIMSSRDVDDAFERLQRLELKGKQDREVVRVISECCAQEKSYNAFYSELAAMLCHHNRQYKTSIQFIFWDNFKLFEDEVAGRRIVNLARLLAHLVTAFHLPLAVLKPVDMTDINANMMLFLATFFMALFSAKITEETFQTMLDRVATTKDFSTVRDNVLYFLQSHLQKIPSGLDPLETKAMERRRKITVKTMEAMSVLDIAAGAMEQEDNEDMASAAEKRSKRSS